MLWSDIKYTSASWGHLPTFWKVTGFCQTLWPETEHPSMGDNQPQSRSERERKNIGSVVIMWHSASHTARIARGCLFIKLKFIRNFCSSCGTLIKQVTRNPRFYGTKRSKKDWGICRLKETKDLWSLNVIHDTELDPFAINSIIGSVDKTCTESEN